MAHINYGLWCLLFLFLSTILGVNSQTTQAASSNTTENSNDTTPAMTTPLRTVMVTEIVTEIVTETPGTAANPETTESTASQMPPQIVLLNTTTGMVSGSTTSVPIPGGEAMLNSYLGIPYAEPPVGDLRFAKPQPRQPWNDTFEALAYGPACPQGDPSKAAGLSEDCLSLNVFVPQADEPLPIMVWIHGGSFTSGSGSLTPGDLLATFGNVIVVTVNYRLGVFGFLSTGDDCARGNWGLWDQRLALQWVNDNAERFGGDASQITLFGNSAGGNSVLYHVHSPLNEGLFQRAIVQSSVTLTTSASGATTAKLLGKELGFNQYDDPNQLMQFLRQDKTMEEIYAGSLSILSGFGPVIDGDLVRKSDTFETSSAINQYDLLLGVNKGDASAFYSDIFMNTLSKEQFIEFVNVFVDSSCHRDTYGTCDGREAAVEAVTFAYNDLQGLNGDGEANLVRAMEAVFDAAFESHASNIAQLHSRSASEESSSVSTYVYEFAYNDTEFYRPDVPRNVIPSPIHVEELFYVFGAALVNTPLLFEKTTLAYQFMSYWTNFARNGDPNVGNTNFIDVEWPKFDVDTQSYLIIQPNVSVGENFAADSYAFWYEYIQNLIEESDEGMDEVDEPSCPLNAPVPVWESIPQSESKTFEIKDGDDEILGWVNGTLVHVSEAIGPPEVNVIRGIPYARPPVGSLRFAPPSPVEPWNGTLDGTLPAPACPNIKALVDNADWDEDCLTLDIAAVNGADSPLPVIVFIMGVNFQDGGEIPSAEVLASGTNSVVVTLRYRVGAFGFLSTGDSSSPGNYGLMDVIAVLEWVQSYIGSFGGDPNQVTLMGYGTGGSIVNTMLLSEKSDGLFHRAVSLSEVTFTRILHTSREIKIKPLAPAVKLGELVGCSYKDPEQLIKCLQSENVTASDILTATTSTESPILFFPVVDDDLLTDTIENLSQNASNIKPVDFLIGVTEDPGAIRLQRASQPEMEPGMEQEESCITEETFREHTNVIINGHLTDPGPITQTVVAEYLENLPPASDDNPCPRLRRAVDFLNDLFFLVPTLHQAKSHVETGGNVYLYSFQQTPKYPGGYANNIPPWVGATFGDDLQYLFGLPYSTNSPGCYGADDRQTTLALMKMLRHFITSGDPSSSLQGVEWPQYDPETRQYLELGTCPSIPESGFAESRFRFWTEIIPVLESPPPIPNPPPGTEKKCIVGENIGLNLSTTAAATLIELLIGVVIGLIILVLLTCAACCGLKKQIKSNQTSDYEIEPIPGGGWFRNEMNEDEASPHL